MKDSPLCLLILLPLTLAYPYNRTLQLSEFNCILSYQQTINGTLSFGHCQQITSATSNFYLTSWEQCINICCGVSFSTYPYFNHLSVSQCNQNNKNIINTNSLIKILVIVVSVFLGTLLAVGIIYKIVRICMQSKVMHEKSIDPSQTVNTNNPKWLQENYEISQATLTNVEVQENYQCPICLQQNTNVVTPCRHRFHIYCLLTWFTKYRNCPLCKRTQLEHLKLGCKHCHKRYVLVYTQRAILDINAWTNFDNNCGTCSILPLMKVTPTSGKDLSLVRFDLSFSFDGNSVN